MLESDHWCPGSDIRTLLWLARLRMSEPKGHLQIQEFNAVLNFTFAVRARGRSETNVKFTALAKSGIRGPPLPHCRFQASEQLSSLFSA